VRHTWSESKHSLLKLLDWNQLCVRWQFASLQGIHSLYHAVFLYVTIFILGNFPNGIQNANSMPSILNVEVYDIHYRSKVSNHIFVLCAVADSMSHIWFFESISMRPARPITLGTDLSWARTGGILSRRNILMGAGNVTVRLAGWWEKPSTT
jgi:hypothetical protein